LLGFVFVFKAVRGIRRGSIHRLLGGGYIGWPDYLSDSYSQSRDGWLFWCVCFYHLAIGGGFIASSILFCGFCNITSFDYDVAYLAGVGAGRIPEIIEMTQVGVSRRSGSTRHSGR
jgi:hypothetical protein